MYMFKVVRHDRCSVTTNAYTLAYEDGKTVTPEVGKIFLFRRFEDAVMFARPRTKFNSDRILMVEAHSVEELHYCSNWYQLSHRIEQYWNEIHGHDITEKVRDWYGVVKTPYGTHGADSILVVCEIPRKIWHEVYWSN